MSKLMGFVLVATLTISTYSYAVQGDISGQGRGGSSFSVSQNGGDGTTGKDGESGMNGCPGGTAPSSDGKYYLPGTNEECNPAD